MVFCWTNEIVMIYTLLKIIGKHMNEWTNIFNGQKPQDKKGHKTTYTCPQYLHCGQENVESRVYLSVTATTDTELNNILCAWNYIYFLLLNFTGGITTRYSHSLSCQWGNKGNICKRWCSSNSNKLYHAKKLMAKFQEKLFCPVKWHWCGMQYI